ncbi:hypothetical protein B0H13DRAFT_1884635 [Mycena leptocephala]|nr:hypothetical protein B0H13DRAFT_1884635 [Mycena leptocephala]
MWGRGGRWRSSSSELLQNTRITISAAWWGAVDESGGQRKTKRAQRTSGCMKERQTHRYSQPSGLCYTPRDRESMCSGVGRDLRSEAAATASFTSTMYEDGGGGVRGEEARRRGRSRRKRRRGGDAWTRAG